MPNPRATHTQLRRIHGFARKVSEYDEPKRRVMA